MWFSVSNSFGTMYRSKTRFMCSKHTYFKLSFVIYIIFACLLCMYIGSEKRNLSRLNIWCLPIHSCENYARASVVSIQDLALMKLDHTVILLVQDMWVLPRVHMTGCNIFRNHYDLLDSDINIQKSLYISELKFILIRL